MACPTCDHTMACLHSPMNTDMRWIFHCERCGTVKEERPGDMECGRPPRIYVPKLVERCRQFNAGALDPDQRDRWHSLGIMESIYPPGELVADVDEPDEPTPLEAGEPMVECRACGEETFTALLSEDGFCATCWHRAQENAGVLEAAPDLSAPLPPVDPKLGEPQF